MQMHIFFKNSSPMLLTFLFFFALLIRLFYLFDLSKLPYFDTYLIGLDQASINQAAQNLANGDWLANSDNNRIAPLYKYFLGFLYVITDQNYYLVYLVQFIFGSISAVLIFKISKDLIGIIPAYFAFFAFSLYGPEIVYEGITLRAGMVTFLGLWSFYLLQKLSPGSTRKSLIWAALATSLFFQIRPNTILCLPFILWHLHRSVFKIESKESVSFGWMIYGGTLVISFVPLLVQSYLVHDRFVFFDASGPIAFMSGNLISYAGYGFDFSALGLFANKAEVSYGQVLNTIISNILEYPFEFFQMYFRKLYFLLNDFEPPSNISLYLYGEHSKILPYLWNHFSLFSALGLVGLVLAISNKEKFFLLYGYTLALSLSVLLFHVVSRFRIPIVPFWIILAAYAVSIIIRQLKSRKYLNVVVISLVALFFIGCFQLPKSGVKLIRHMDYCNLGMSYLKRPDKFDIKKVEEIALQCWEIDPDRYGMESNSRKLLAGIYEIYGFHLFQENRYEDAYKALMESLLFDQYRVGSYRLLAIILAREKHKGNAEQILRLGVLANPQSKELNSMLSDIYFDKATSLVFQSILLNRKLSFEADEVKKKSISNRLNHLKTKIQKSRGNWVEEINEAKNLYKKKKWQEAIRMYKQVNLRNLDQEILFLEQGIVYKNLNEMDSAIDSFYRGLMIQPSNYDLNMLLGNYYFSKKEWLPVIIHYEKALKSSSNKNNNEDLLQKIQSSQKAMVEGRQLMQIPNLNEEQQLKIYDLYRNITN